MTIFHPFVERHLQREKAVPSVWWGHCKTGLVDGMHDWTDVWITANNKSIFG